MTQEGGGPGSDTAVNIADVLYKGSSWKNSRDPPLRTSLTGKCKIGKPLSLIYKTYRRLFEFEEMDWTGGLFMLVNFLFYEFHMESDIFMELKSLQFRNRYLSLQI